MLRHEVRTDIGPGVHLLTLDRPERRNALDHDTILQIIEVQQGLVDARVVVLTGASPAFCAGADLNGVEDDMFTRDLERMLVGFTSLNAVTMAAVDGPALGAGTQLVSACDLRIATCESTFGIPAARLGLVIEHSSVERVIREFGWPVARAMLLAAATYQATELHPMGSIHRLGTLDDALAWAGKLALLAPLTISGHKLAIETSAALPGANADVQAARDRAWASADAAEGRTAFLDKRRPNFTGR